MDSPIEISPECAKMMCAKCRGWAYNSVTDEMEPNACPCICHPWVPWPERN